MHLRFAALGAVGPPGEERIIHDATNAVGVNCSIRVRGQDETPLYSDVAAALEQDFRTTGVKTFPLTADVLRAHRRIPIAPIDGGLQACSQIRLGQVPMLDDIVYLNAVGTYGVGSARYHWNRLGALLLRVVLYVNSDAGLRWGFRFADDCLFIAGGTCIAVPLVTAVLLLLVLGVPLKGT